MTDATLAENDPPAWAKGDAFPEAPPGFGWLDEGGRQHALGSLQELIAFLSSDVRPAVLLVWTDRHGRMVLPEELADAAEELAAANQRRLAKSLRKNFLTMLVIGFGVLILLCYTMSTAYSGGGGMAATWKSLMNSTAMGMGLLVFLIVGFIPWYQTWKEFRESKQPADGGESVADVMRFETWMELQRAPVTRLMALIISLVGLVQWLVGPSIAVPPGSLHLDGPVWVAGLVKPTYHHGEWWRLFTAPMLHGGLVHFLMNVSALFYLGKRVELFARWPHVFLVFQIAALAGSICSANWMAAPSIGASGGLMGWLGFLLVFESLHGRLVPRSSKRRLFAGLLLTVVIGLIGYRFIDNAAHFGGAAAGMLYAAIVFPRSGSNRRPQVMMRDRVAGLLAAMMLVASALAAVWLMVVNISN